MRVAVYTIALNEEKHVERWYNSAKEADYVLIADTGSTDRTVEIAESLGINVVHVAVSPFRFDVARNAALAALPLDIDYCVSLDMDELLTEGWRTEFDSIEPVDSAIYRSTLTWNFPADGSTGLQYGADRIHSRKGCMWKFPAHELMTTYGDAPEKRGWVHFGIEHHADATKSRAQYLGILKIGAQEDPESDRAAYYYARELFFNGMLELAESEFTRYLSLPTAVWKSERASAMRFIAKCSPEKAENWLMSAIQEAPNQREPLVDLAQHYYSREMWENCFDIATRAISITEKSLDYFCEEFAWGSGPYDLAAISAWKLNDYPNAVKYGSIAVELNPTDERLASNLVFYKSK